MDCICGSHRVVAEVAFEFHKKVKLAEFSHLRLRCIDCNKTGPFCKTAELAEKAWNQEMERLNSEFASDLPNES